MTSNAVIEHFDVVEHIGLGQVTGFVDPLSDPFLFQTAEEGLGYRIVPTVAPPTHARFQVMGPTETMPVIAAVLRSLDALLRVKQLFSTDSLPVVAGARRRKAHALCNVSGNG